MNLIENYSENIATKICTLCKENKNLVEFGKDSSKRDGKYPRCKSCSSLMKIEAAKRWNKVNRSTVYTQQMMRRQNDLSRYRQYARSSWLRRACKDAGISVEYYYNLVKLQNGKCCICNNKPVKRLSIDHDHKTGKFRG